LPPWAEHPAAASTFDQRLYRQIPARFNRGRLDALIEEAMANYPDIAIQY
jgi:hypothetical protein